MAKETGAEDAIPSGHRWDDLEALPAPNRLEPTSSRSTSAATARGSCGDLCQRQLLHQETGHALHAGDRDRQARLGTAHGRRGLGDLYEGLLEKNANEKKSGATSTSRRVR
jgi:type I restriction enzyme M protein